MIHLSTHICLAAGKKERAQNTHQRRRQDDPYKIYALSDVRIKDKDDSLIIQKNIKCVSKVHTQLCDSRTSHFASVTIIQRALTQNSTPLSRAIQHEIQENMDPMFRFAKNSFLTKGEGMMVGGGDKAVRLSSCENQQHERDRGRSKIDLLKKY